MKTNAPKTIGLAVGGGTGPELAEAFLQVVEALARLYQVEVRVERSPRTYRSYQPVTESHRLKEVMQITDDDAAHYEGFCRSLAQSGVSAIFRTAINAQALYRVRQRLQAVKVEHLVTEEADLLLVRDQAQGFYTGENDYQPGVIARTCSFSQELTAKIIAFALAEARRHWRDQEIARVIMAYKFHLLDGVFTSWVERCARDHGVPIELCQPDTANRNLLRDGLVGRTLLIGSNEWADIMHVILLERLGLGAQENRCTRNIYLHPELRGLTEYQTVHGSGDDLAGTGRVNPIAAMRAAAAMMEGHAGCGGAETALEQAVRCARVQEVVTPDLHGKSSTSEVVAFCLDRLNAHFFQRLAA